MARDGAAPASARGLPVSAATTLRGGIAASAVLHLGLIGALMLANRGGPPPMPPVYSVELIAAPAGAPAIGEVAPAVPAAPTPAAPAPTPPAPAAKAAPTAKSVPAPKPKVAPKAVNDAAAASKLAPPKSTPVATPVPPAATTPPKSSTASPAAGGGPTGGAGADVATVRTEGIAFPFPGYLQNIVRQIAVRFKLRTPQSPLRADVAFLIHRDGTVSNLRFVSRSGSYAFDLEAQGAVEAAAASRAFGALPVGFSDDVLPVTFAFDPRVIR
jgi:outer membrane biosynthesis protein TonB